MQMLFPRSIRRWAVSVFALHLAIAVTGCEGRHIDASRLARNDYPEKPYEPPPATEAKLYSLTLRRLTSEGVDPAKDPAVFRADSYFEGPGYGRDHYLETFYVAVGGEMRAVEDDAVIGAAMCEKSTAGGGCEQYQFDFAQTSFAGSAHVMASWSLGDRFRLKGAFDEQTTSLNWGEGRIEEVFLQVGEVAFRGRVLRIEPPAVPLPDSAVRLSEYPFSLTGTTKGQQQLNFFLSIPVPKTDADGHRLIWQSLLSDFSGTDFFEGLPASTSLSGSGRKFGDAESIGTHVHFTLEKVVTERSQ